MVPPAWDFYWWTIICCVIVSGIVMSVLICSSANADRKKGLLAYSSPQPAGLSLASNFTDGYQEFARNVPVHELPPSGTRATPRFKVGAKCSTPTGREESCSITDLLRRFEEISSSLGSTSRGENRIKKGARGRPLGGTPKAAKRRIESLRRELQASRARLDELAKVSSTIVCEKGACVDEASDQLAGIRAKRKILHDLNRTVEEMLSSWGGPGESDLPTTDIPPPLIPINFDSVHTPAASMPHPMERHSFGCADAPLAFEDPSRLRASHPRTKRKSRRGCVSPATSLVQIAFPPPLPRPIRSGNVLQEARAYAPAQHLAVLRALLDGSDDENLNQSRAVDGESGGEEDIVNHVPEENEATPPIVDF